MGTHLEWAGIAPVIRAIGGFYCPRQSLPETVTVDFSEIERRRRMGLLVAERIERLDRELQNLGIRPIQAIWRD